MDNNPFYAPGHQPKFRAIPPREEVLGFVMLKDGRTMSAAVRRVDDVQWEAVYALNGERYLTKTLENRDLADQHLARHKDALNAAGWQLES